MSKKNVEEDVIIAVAELNDQFAFITNIEIIDKTEKALIDLKAKYTNTSLYSYNTYFFKGTLDDFDYLKNNLLDTALGQDNIREWMEEHN